MNDWYKKPQIQSQNCSNNGLSFEERFRLNKGKNPELYVPDLVEGKVSDVKFGDEIVFEDFDDEGVLRSCKGLKQYVRTVFETEAESGLKKIPAYIFDNHNHAFAFWNVERYAGQVRDGALLIHVDQHKDTRIPPSFLSIEDAKNLKKVFDYTNTVLNVGNFIPAAQNIGLVKDIIFIDSERSIDEFDFSGLVGRDLILDIDLDFFVPDLDYIGNNKKIDLIGAVLPYANVITFATSPFFIDQQLALDWLVRIAGLVKN